MALWAFDQRGDVLWSDRALTGAENPLTYLESGVYPDGAIDHLVYWLQRVFVGDHYLSDVLAGYALGIAWTGLVVTSTN